MDPPFGGMVEILAHTLKTVSRPAGIFAFVVYFFTDIHMFDQNLFELLIFRRYERKCRNSANVIFLPVLFTTKGVTIFTNLLHVRLQGKETNISCKFQIKIIPKNEPNFLTDFQIYWLFTG